jgi:hypothetical protein
MGAAFPNPFAKKKIAQHERFEVNLPAGLVLLPRDVVVEGMILNVSEGGCLFRPYQTHLLNRTGDRAAIMVRGHRLEGRIMNTIPKGYGVAFERLVDVTFFLRLAQAAGRAAV